MDIAEISHSFSRGASPEVSAAASALIVEWADKLSAENAADLARAIAESGQNSGGIIRLPEQFGPYADCPSTGGLGSLTTLLSPLLVAAGGVFVPKISADGAVSGAIDTMQLVPGFRAELDSSEFIKNLTEVGIAHIAQSPQFCPADRILIKERRAKKKMECIPLAAISLLSKKLVVSGCAAAFDFRVGEVGNVGTSVDAAKCAAQFFEQVAKILNMKIAIMATNNEYSLCSGIGRVESLRLIWDILNGREDFLEIDQIHIETCIHLAARAINLVRSNESMADCINLIRQKINDGTAKRLFAKHIKAQGAHTSELTDVFRKGDDRYSTKICSEYDGPWQPPKAITLKNWHKDASAICKSNLRGGAFDADQQVGMKMLVTPGTIVQKNQAVMCALWPRHMAEKITPPPWGCVNENVKKDQILF